MNKKATDRIINRWALRCLLGPASLICVFAFVVGYSYPDGIAVVQPIAQQLGLHYLVALRTVGSEFHSAAYLYWLTFWVVLPFNLVWLYWEGIRQSLPTAMRAVARANLNSGHWNPSKYTLWGGYLRFIGFVLCFGALFAVQLVTAWEPSYCKGCETTSVLGFALTNWLATYVLLLANYFAASYFVLWKSIRIPFENDE